MKTIEVKRTINNLYAFLKSTDADQIIIRTSYCKGGWHDSEFSAKRAGFRIVRFSNPEYIARHEFAECYRITRK